MSFLQSLEGWQAVLIASGLATVVGALSALLLRRAGFAGGALSAGIFGGVIGGLLLGAGILGRAAPGAYEGLLIGGVEERQSLEELDSRQRADVRAMAQVDVTEVAIEELRRRHEIERAPLEDALDAARAERRRQVGLAALILAAAWGATAGVRTALSDRRRGMAGEGIVGPLSAGLWSAVVAGVPAGLLAAWTLGVTAREAAAFGAALGIGSAFLSVRSRMVGAGARRAGIDLAGVAAMGVGVAALLALSDDGATPWFAIALLIGFIGTRTRRGSKRVRRIIQGFESGVALPAAVALAVATLDPFALGGSGAFWIAAVIAALLSSDGRWLGGWLGWWTAGTEAMRAEAWTRSAAMVNAGVGAMQTMAAIVLWQANLLTEPMLGGAIVGAAVVEASAGIRGKVGVMLDRGAPFGADATI